MMDTTHYAERACQETVVVTENVRLARDTYRVRFDCPTLARRIVPGQFLMLRLAGENDPLLGRPLALYDTVVDAAGTPTGADVVYLVVGKMTSRLAKLRAGDRLDVWGPLGNGFSTTVDIPLRGMKNLSRSERPTVPTDHLIMVAGGIGQTPFLALGREALGLRSYGDPERACPPIRKVTLCYGARNAEYLAGVDDFRALGLDMRLSTDDGSAGRKGFVTDLLREVLDAEPAGASRRIVCCGPEKMMEAVAHLASKSRVPCEVSLETPMACGIGICFSCVTKVRDDAGGWDYRRTCVEGPVFDAERIVF
jgi:dihydroorotate dehydrogenase electron transfer subunit